MEITSEVRGQLESKFEVLLPHLNERQRRLLLAAEARLLWAMAGCVLSRGWLG